MPVAPMEIKNQGCWLPLRVVTEYAGKSINQVKNNLVVGNYSFKKDEIKFFDGIIYAKSDVLVKALEGERVYRADIARTIIDIPRMPVPLSAEQIEDFPSGNKLYISSKDSIKQLSVTPWVLYSKFLPAIDKKENIYWQKSNAIYYKPANTMNYQEIYRSLNCSIQMRGFDFNNNLICEITNDKPGEHEIWMIKNDGTRKLIDKGFGASVAKSGEMLAFCRRENDNTRIFIKSLTSETAEVLVNGGYKVLFAPDSASLLYYKGKEIIRQSLINGVPGNIISKLSLSAFDQEISIWSEDNKYFGGKGRFGIFVSSLDKVLIQYLTGNPDDYMPVFRNNDILFLRNNRLMITGIDDGRMESEIFPGLNIANYKVLGDKIVFTATGTVLKKADSVIDIDVAEVVKAVEKTAERKVGEISFGQISPENSAGIIAKRYISSMQKEAWDNAIKISQEMLGLYDETTGRVYIIPQNIRKIADDLNIKDIAKMVLTHEMIHKMQLDFNDGLPADFDGKLAWSAVTEGQAVIVTKNVAKDMKISTAVMEKIDDFIIDKMPNRLTYSQHIAGKMTAEIYNAGEKFMTWQMANGGNEKMWQIIKNPPINTDTIYHPQQYPEKQNKTDYSYLLEDINNFFPVKMLYMMNMTIGTMAQRVVYNDMDTNDKAVLLDHIIAGQTTLLDNKSQTASVSVIMLDSAKLTGRFIVAVEKIALKNNPKLTVDSFVCGDIAGRKIINDKNIIYRALYDKTVIEINANGIILTDNSAAKIINQIILKLKRK